MSNICPSEIRYHKSINDEKELYNTRVKIYEMMKDEFNLSNMYSFKVLSICVRKNSRDDYKKMIQFGLLPQDTWDDIISQAILICQNNHFYAHKIHSMAIGTESLYCEKHTFKELYDNPYEYIPDNTMLYVQRVDFKVGNRITKKVIDKCHCNRIISCN